MVQKSRQNENGPQPKNIEDIGASSVAIKDMSGLLRPYEAFDLITLLKKN